MKKKILAAAVAALFAASAQAAVTADEAATLGNTLTPIGAEKAANKAGTIPAWTGGLTTPIASFKTGGHYPDPYADDKVQFTIDASNMEKYKDQLSPGQMALLKRYSDWKMNVYPTRRSAGYPQGIYDETLANATKVKLVESGNGFTGTSGGTPFPIPKSGLELIWNHITSYKGDTYRTSWSQAPVTAGGDYNLVNFDYEYDFVYSNQKKKPEQREPNLLFYFLQLIKQPPRLAGSVLLVHEFADQVTQPRKAWTYNPGQRRVRLAPSVSYDNPGTAADGLRTNDDFFMFNGATDRYDWKIVGKKEMFVPYNSYVINGPTLKVKDVLKAGHVNADPARYELHRVWELEANLKSGTSHLYKKRVFYIDEDSWIILAQDKYDNRDQLWRVDELHTTQYYDVPFLAAGLEVKHDLQSGRYLALSIRNEETKVYDRVPLTPADFTPDALRSKGTR
ncbi:uncharacterized protein DUF1329 [Panacagrimonas perspica]|uniref:Uncharacterized protein DUF1329 n=1 Tax=Panacagrimonas perspica TaxID=381431 RepID=A0A4R7PBP3_9GAMM|nr:DUF1329 domain-containing protein [Panacagrimonas perspica]TDU31514.1 uncharacterized protein DUF1329 [Panacagrimonas perspica]THD03248.1 outer membrane lipoprotein-sorting protein [Panacagrimonas perspica]